MIEDKGSKQKFLDILQKEYIVFSLRMGFYPSEGDKKYFSNLLKYKKEKILDISEKLAQNTIFSSEEMLVYYVSLVCRDFTSPNFFYVEQTLKEYWKKDLIYYYKVGGKFTFSYNGNLVVKELIFVDIKNKICYFRENLETFKKSFDEIERDFTFDLNLIQFKL